jgi:hypothetical protein
MVYVPVSSINCVFDQGKRLGEDVFETKEAGICGQSFSLLVRFIHQRSRFEMTWRLQYESTHFRLCGFAYPNANVMSLEFLWRAQHGCGRYFLLGTEHDPPV